jgi:ubiquitin C-terminal hydrolase
MANVAWWTKPYQPTSAEPANALLKDCAICGKFALNRCSSCKEVGYCGRDCQRKHWPEHKKVCGVASLSKTRTPTAAKPKTTNTAAVSPTSSTAAAAAVAPATPPSNSTIPIATTELYPYDTFITNWRSISLSNRVPCGIFNLGNTCYINAILQVLLATRPLTAFLLTREHTCPSPTANGYSNGKRQWCPLCCLVSLAQEFFENSPQTAAKVGGSRGKNNNSNLKDPLSIRHFTNFVHQLNSSFTFGDQHDAQELYVALLDAIECVFLRESEAKTEGGAATVKKLDQFSKQTTLMNHVFTCYTRTQVECTMCGKISKSYATDTGIMLSVPKKKQLSPLSYTLDKLLENFTAVEILEGDDAYRCDACCARVKAHKSNVIEIAPNILAIQLSRVGMDFFSTEGEIAQKNTAAVEFPLEFDLTPFMALDALDAAPAEYELYAVVTHEGSTTEDGHYISLVRYGGGSGSTIVGDGSRTASCSTSSTGANNDKQKGQWFVCDDDVVSPLNVDVVLQQQEEAYLLFYERKQPRMPQLLGHGGGIGGDITMANGNSSLAASIDIIEKVTPTTTPKVRPSVANGTGEVESVESEKEEEEKLKIENAAVSYVFEMENSSGGSRVLRLKVCLPGSVADYSKEEPQIDLELGKPVFAEVSCGGYSLLRMPLPVPVELPAREVEWNKSKEVLDVLFDVV